MSYQVILFPVGEKGVAKTRESLIESLATTFGRDFPRRELFVTLSISKNDYEEMEIVEEEIKDNIGIWIDDLSKVRGKLKWQGARLICGKEGRNIDVDKGFVVLYNANAIISAVIIPLSVFEGNEKNILEIVNAIGNSEEADMTMNITPALFIEVYAEAKKSVA